MKLGKSRWGTPNRLSVGVACLLTAILLLTGNAEACDPPTYYDLTIEIRDAEGNPGIVSPAVGTHTYQSGTVVTLQATANQGWRFSHWESGGQTISNNPYYLNMNSDKIVTAVFEVHLYVSTDTGGTVTQPGLGNFWYDYNEEVTLEATPSTGYRFDEFVVFPDADPQTWFVIGENPGSIVMTEEFWVQPTWVRVYTLTTNVSGSGAVYRTPDQAQYDEGSTVELFAQADGGWRFDHWEGDLTGDTNPTTITMNSDKSVTAVFTSQYYLNLSPEIRTSASPEGPWYDPGTTVTLTATPLAGRVFECWHCEGDPINFSTDNPVTITMDSDKSVYASFWELGVQVETLTVHVDGTGTITPNGGMFVSGTEIEVLAQGTGGWMFDHWEGDLSGWENPAPLTMSEPRDVTAVFLPGCTFTISVQGEGEVFPPEGGTVPSGREIPLEATPAEGYAFSHWNVDGQFASDEPYYPLEITQNTAIEAVFVTGKTLTTTVDPGFEAGWPEMSPEAAGGEVIGASRYELYPPGAEVEVTAMHNDGYVFDYWEFDGVQYNSGPVFTVTLNDDESLLASFSRGKVIGTQVYPEYTGKVEYDPDYPGGIDQNGTRTETYSEGATVSITAVPELGYAFDYWQELVTEKSGEVTYNTDPVMTLVAEEDVSYEASFVSGYIVSATAYPDLNSGTIEYNPDYPGGETEENTIRESFKPGTAMTLTAVPTAGNAFDHWEIDSENVGSWPLHQMSLEGDLNIDAIFTTGKTLTMTVSPDEQAGAIEVYPDFPGGERNAAVRNECYLTNSLVTVVAVPETGYLFDHWEGDDIHDSTHLSGRISLDDDKSITACFVEGKVLTVEIVGNGEVTPWEGQHTYATNTVVTGITATPADGWWFDHWEVDLSGSASPTSITLDADKTIRAVFKTNFTLTMAVSGSGTVTPAAGPHTQESGDVVALNAVADTGWWFHHWECEGDPIHGTTSALTNLTMDGDKTATAVFVQHHTLSMAVDGEGTVTPAAGEHSYGDNDVATVSATPASGWRFDHWEGDLTGDTNPTNLTMDGDKSVTAVFIEQHTLTIAQEGNGTLTPTAGTYTKDHGDTVALIAVPDANWVFDHWEGDEYGFDESISFEMTSDKSVTAVFRQEFDVTFAVTGTGRLDPAVGTYTYRTNEQIPLAAFPDAGWRFDHWEGGLTGSENPATLTVTAETTVTGVFVKTYRVRTAAQGMGTVELTPDGEIFDTGTTIQLAATADSGWQFDHWECAGDAIHNSTTNPDTVTADRDKTILAVFRKEYTLDLAVQGSGSTTPAAGTYTHLSGDEISISTASGTGHLFSHWEGDASGSDDPLTVVMNNDKDITAIFLDGYDLTTSVQGQGTVDPSSGLYLPGTEVEITATPAENYTLDRWIVNGTTYANSGPVTTLVMDDDKNVTAVFDVGYALSATVLTGGSTGSVEFDPDYPGGTVNGDTRTEIYKADTEVELTAVAEVGYIFDYWEESGVQYNSPPQYTVTMDSSRSVSVGFAEGTMVTTVVSPDETAGYVEYSPDWPGGADDANVRTETYRPGTEVTLTAAHRDGYYFDHWEQNGATVGTEPTCTVTVDADDVTLTAVFLPGYTLWMNVRRGEGAFDVNPDYPGGTVEGTYRVETYPEDSIVVLNPVPAEGYAFFNYLVWRNDKGGAEVFEPELTLTMQDWPWQSERMEPYNKKVELQFVPGVTLTATVDKINQEVPGSVSITPDVPGGTATETEWTEIFVPGAEAEVLALPATGFRFSHWEGDDIQGNTEPLATLVMDTEKAVEAVFTSQRVLKVQKFGEGTVTPSPGSYYYDEDTNISLSASPAQDWWFDHWSVPGDANDGSTNTQITVTVDGVKTATAVFKRDFTITVATAGAGSGSVSPAAGNHTFTFLDEVPFTATAAPGSAFSHWEGGLTGVANPETLVVMGDATVTAYFVPTYPLSVTIQGSGSVAKSPDLQYYPAGTTVTLQATPDSGYEFDSWSGDASGSSETVDVVMDSAKSVTATFSQGERLSMSVQGRGTTTPASGNHFYSTDQQVTLTAAPDAGFDFVRWSCPGDAIDGSTNSQVQITMSADKAVQAIFTEHTLTTAISNGQTGDSITPTAGTHTYADGAVVTVEATEGASSSFDHWTGALSGSVNPTTLVMDADKSVTAVFDAKRTLTLTKTGQGVLTPAVGTHYYPDGKEVSITATPTDGYVFAGWTGDATGNDNPLVVTMDADKSIEARFWNMRKLTVNVVGKANVTLDPYFGDPITPGTGEHYFFYGDTVLVTLTNGTGWSFSHWEGDASGTSTRVYIQMKADKTITAIMKADFKIGRMGPGTVTPPVGHNYFYQSQEVQLTATPDEGCMFKHWKITPFGSDQPQFIEEPNPVVQVVEPVEAKAVFIYAHGLHVNVDGQGSVAVEPDKEEYGEGEIVHLTATPDPNWAFDRWTGNFEPGLMRPRSADVETTITHDLSLSAIFVECPGQSAIDMANDWAVLIGYVGSPENHEDSDHNGITYDPSGNRIYAGNGIPDLAELELLEGILGRYNLDLSARAGVCHEPVWQAWSTNLAQAESDLSGQPAWLQRAVAGFATLGDYATVGYIDSVVETHFNSEGLSTSLYDKSRLRFLHSEADADNDGCSNLEEWDSTAGVEPAERRSLFVERALDGVPPDGYAPASKSLTKSDGCDTCEACLPYAEIIPDNDPAISEIILTPDVRELPFGEEMSVETKWPSSRLYPEYAHFDCWQASNSLLQGSPFRQDRLIPTPLDDLFDVIIDSDPGWSLHLLAVQEHIWQHTTTFDSENGAVRHDDHIIIGHPGFINLCATVIPSRQDALKIIGWGADNSSVRRTYTKTIRVPMRSFSEIPDGSYPEEHYFPYSFAYSEEVPMPLGAKPLSLPPSFDSHRGNLRCNSAAAPGLLAGSA